jgi:hypothetical protein
MSDVATLLFVHFNHIEVISIQKLIKIDRRKLVEILVLILKEVIELCHIWIFLIFKHFFNGTIYEILDCKAIIYWQPLSMGYLIPRLVISLSKKQK